MEYFLFSLYPWGHWFKSSTGIWGGDSFKCFFRLNKEDLSINELCVKMTERPISVSDPNMRYIFLTGILFRYIM